MWKYFQSLKWIMMSIPFAFMALAKGGAAVLDSSISDVQWLRNQFSPETCEEKYLPRHGRARGIIQRDNETIESYRIRVVNAYAWQFRGGRKASLESCLDDHGYPNCTIINLREEDETRWAEFRVEIPVFREEKVMLAEDYVGIAEVCNDQKPARSKLDAIRTTNDLQGDLYFAGVVSQTNIITIPNGEA